MKKISKKLDQQALFFTDRERIRFTELLFLVFLHLKLTGEIEWSWWFVSLPLAIQYFVSLLFWYREYQIRTKMAKEEIDND
jgi:Transmembrane Fragile-X-F protein